MQSSSFFVILQFHIYFLFVHD